MVYLLKVIQKNGIIVKSYSEEGYNIPIADEDTFNKENLKSLLFLERGIRLSPEWLDIVKATSEADSDKWMDYASKLQESIIDAHFSSIKLSLTRRAELLSEYRNIRKTHPEFINIPIQVKNNRVIPELISIKEGNDILDIKILTDRGFYLNLSDIIRNEKIMILSGSIT